MLLSALALTVGRRGSSPATATATAFLLRPAPLLPAARSRAAAEAAAAYARVHHGRLHTTTTTGRGHRSSRLGAKGFDEEEAEEADDDGDLLAAAATAAPARVPNAIVPGTIYFVATPLGNLGDMTLRALDVLKGVDLIAAEDTRTTGLLLKALGLEKKPQVSHHQHNVAGRVPDLVRRAKDERLSIAVVSDAGTPGISDPGTELAAACWAAGVPVVPVPGACAAVAAVSVAGFASTEFVFLGFLPAKGGKARKSKVAEVVGMERPCVLYEAPHRLLKTLTELAEADEAAAGGGKGGSREVLCARELTKMHEELFKGTIREAIVHFEAKPPRGEFTLVVGPRVGELAGATVEEKEEVARGLLRGLMGEEGVSASEAAKRVAKEMGMAKGQVYRLAMEVKEGGGK